ncbi:MAG TPA: terminase family protein [Bryobacteraceae bacterium]
MTTKAEYDYFAAAHKQVRALRRMLRAHSFNAAEFARVALRWEPDAKQAAVLRSGARRVILNCSRQWGKTTVAAAKLVFVALTRPKSVSITVSENISQTAEVFQKIDQFLGGLGIGVKSEQGKKLARVIAMNGSRIVGLAAREQAVRGYTADFVFLDEAARIPDDVIDALLPVIAVRNGDWWMASTPNGRRGRFYEMWEYAEGADVLKIAAPGSENPRLPAGFVERARKERGEAYVRQEFECEFVENGTFLLDRPQVDAVYVP